MVRLVGLDEDLGIAMAASAASNGLGEKLVATLSAGVIGKREE